MQLSYCSFIHFITLQPLQNFECHILPSMSTEPSRRLWGDEKDREHLNEEDTLKYVWYLQA